MVLATGCRVSDAPATGERCGCASPFFEAAQAAGTCAYLRGDYQQAADHYAVAMDVDPDSASLYINIANLFHALGQFKEAVAMLERSITLQPDNHIAYNNLGNALKALGTDPQVVLAHYNQAMQIKPDYAPAHINAAHTSTLPSHTKA